MVRNIYHHKFVEKIFELNNMCLSTIAFVLIFVSLVLYSFDVISLVREAYFVLIMLIIFASDQLLLKPFFSKVEESIK
jgi:hypothetical protein